MTQAEKNSSRKMPPLEFAAATGNVTRACRRFAVSNETFYESVHFREPPINDDNRAITSAPPLDLP